MCIQMTVRRIAVAVVSVCAIAASLFAVVSVFRYIRDFPSQNARASLRRQLADITDGNSGVVSLSDNIEASDEFVASLSQISALPPFALHCYDTQNTDRLIERIQGLSNVLRVTLASTDVSDRGICKLAALPSIEHLDLYKARVSQEGIECLSALPKLESIAVRPAEGSVSLIEAILKLPHVRRVRLYETPHGPWLDIDAIIRATPSTLAILELGGITLSETDHMRLRSALPNCDVSTGIY
jgi:hypothetical protein